MDQFSHKKANSLIQLCCFSVLGDSFFFQTYLTQYESILMTKDLRECQIRSGHYSVCKSTSDSTQPHFRKSRILIPCNTIMLALISESLLSQFPPAVLAFDLRKQDVTSQPFLTRKLKKDTPTSGRQGHFFFLKLLLYLNHS